MFRKKAYILRVSGNWCVKVMCGFIAGEVGKIQEIQGVYDIGVDKVILSERWVKCLIHKEFGRDEDTG